MTRPTLPTAEREWRSARFRVRALVVAEWAIAILAVVSAVFVGLACLAVLVISAALYVYRCKVAEPERREAFVQARLYAFALMAEEDDARREARRNRRVPWIYQRGIVSRGWN